MPLTVNLNKLSAKRPLLLPMILFALGLFTGRYLDVPIAYLYIVFSVTFLVIIVASHTKYSGNKYLKNPLALFYILGLIFINPIVNPLIDEKNILNTVGDGERPKLSAYARIVSPVEYVNKSTRFTVELIHILNYGKVMSTQGRALVRVNGYSDGLSYGDTVNMLATFKRPGSTHNPGVFDYDWYLKRKGVHVVASVNDKRLIIKSSQGSFGLLNFTEGLRSRVNKFIDGGGYKEPELLKALTTGTKRGMDSLTKETFIATGTIHLLAISGLHVGLVAALFYGLLMYVFKRSGNFALKVDVHRLALIMTALMIVFYCLLAGYSLPTIRASVMAVAVITALLIGRASDVYNLLIVAAFAILIFFPGALWDLSFLLTFTAVLAIVYMTPRLVEIFKDDEIDKIKIGRKENFLRRLNQFIFVNFSATLGTLAIIAWGFNRVSLISPVANLFAVPLVAMLVVPMCLLSSIAVLLNVAPLAHLFFYAADIVLQMNSALLELLSQVSFASLYVVTPTLSEVVCFYTILIALFYYKRYKSAFVAVNLSVFIIVLTNIYYPISHKLGDKLEVTYISVGQGDSILVEMPGGKNMLIDGGPKYIRNGEVTFDAGRQVVAPFLWKNKIDKIDIVVLSHNQSDHRGGLGFIMEHFAVDEFWHSGESSLNDMGGLNDIMEKNEISHKIINPFTGETNINGVAFKGIWPLPGNEYNINDRSLVLLMEFGERSFLFTGDIGKQAERDLVEAYGDDLKIDVLKVAHHGSNTSTSEEFISTISPEYAIISAGRNNSFGFPKAKVLKTLNEKGIKVLRTDLNGAVKVVTDGETLKVKSFLTEKGEL